MIKYVDLNSYNTFTEGSLGQPPYTLEQYNKAKDNIDLIQTIINESEQDGTTEIIFKKTNFSVCYTGALPAEILFSENIVYNFNNIEIDVIYDSINRSPFDLTNNSVYRFGGTIFSFKNANNNIIVKNLKIKGDIFNRSFSDTESGFNSERGMENTKGFTLGYCTNNITIENCEIEGFMADSIGGVYRAGRGSSEIGSSTYTSYVVGDWGNTYNRATINESTGLLETSSNMHISNKTPINLNKVLTISKRYSDFLYIRRQGGYNRSSTLKSNNIKVYFYNEDVYIGHITTEYMKYFTLPEKATHFIIGLFNEDLTQESITTPGYFLCMPLCQDLKLVNCSFRYNHRGGIANCGDDLIIDNCIITENGKDSNIGVPLFPDSTRYGINIEDVYGKKTIIKNSKIYSNGNVDITYGGDVFNSER